MKRRSSWYDVILLAIAVGVFIAMFVGFDWMNQSKANADTVLNVLRYKFDGPSSALLMVAFAWVMWKLTRPKRKR